MDQVNSLISSNKSLLHNVLIFMIVIEHFPLKSDFPQLFNTVKPLLDLLNNIFNMGIVKFVLFVILLWTCCIKKDMNTFLLMAIFFNTYYK